MRDIIKGILAIVTILGIVFALSYGLMVVSENNSREEAGMVKIEEGLTYHKASKVVYIESTGYYNNSYTPYLDSSGSKCIFEDGKIVPIKEDNNNE